MSQSCGFKTARFIWVSDGRWTNGEFLLPYKQDPNAFEMLPVKCFLRLQALSWGRSLSGEHPGIQSPPQFLASLVAF